MENINLNRNDFKILNLLKNKNAHFLELQRQMEISSKNLTPHLKKLENYNLITIKKPLSRGHKMTIDLTPIALKVLKLGEEIAKHNSSSNKKSNSK